MIGQIGPLVQGNPAKYKVVASHVGGGAAGGLFAGVLLGWVATLVSAAAGQAWDTVRIATLVVLGVLAALSDLSVLPHALMQSQNRQTPRGWNCVFGPMGAALAWGADLALVVTTRVSYQAMLLVLAAAVLAPNIWIAIAVMMCFGATRALATSYHALRANDVDETVADVDTRYLPFRHVLGLGSIGLAVLMAVTQFVPALT